MGLNGVFNHSVVLFDHRTDGRHLKQIAGHISVDQVEIVVGPVGILELSTGTEQALNVDFDNTQ